jgi:hypothetical protein
MVPVVDGGEREGQALPVYRGEIPPEDGWYWARDSDPPTLCNIPGSMRVGPLQRSWAVVRLWRKTMAGPDHVCMVVVELGAYAETYCLPRDAEDLVTITFAGPIRRPGDDDG